MKTVWIVVYSQGAIPEDAWAHRSKAEADRHVASLADQAREAGQTVGVTLEDYERDVIPEVEIRVFKSSLSE